jgi:hypothetical protein
MPTRANLVAEYGELIRAIEAEQIAPAAVVLDTLNRSLQGSESDDKDMGAYVKAADAIRETFNCAVIVIHHCGVEGTRPRGHTSLTGAADAQLACKRDAAGNVTVTVEWLKDGPEGDAITSRLESVEVGYDEDGDPITSCIVVPVEDKIASSSPTEPKLTKNQQTMYSLLREAGSKGLLAEEWNEQLRAVGIGSKRKADIYDTRKQLKDKGLVREFNGRWTAAT